MYILSVPILVVSSYIFLTFTRPTFRYVMFSVKHSQFGHILPSNDPSFFQLLSQVFEAFETVNVLSLSVASCNPLIF